MDHRLQFVAEARRTDESFTALARYGIAPKTGYEWLARFEAEGPAGLRAVHARDVCIRPQLNAGFKWHAHPQYA